MLPFFDHAARSSHNDVKNMELKDIDSSDFKEFVVLNAIHKVKTVQTFTIIRNLILELKAAAGGFRQTLRTLRTGSTSATQQTRSRSAS